MLGKCAVIGKMLRRDKSFNWSLIDQFFVSGGNFLSIVLCANYLPLDEQGKLGYILAWYFGSIIINNSAIFQHASVKAPAEVDRECYLGELAWMQVGLATGVSLVFAVLIISMSGLEGLSLTVPEVVLFTIYILVQQLADFSRRAAYIFEDSKQSAKLSSILFTTRVLLLVLVEPSDISSVLLIFVTASLFSLIKTISILLRMSNLLYKSWAFVKQHVAESKWFIRAGPVIWLWSSLPIFLLGGMIDAAAIAIFFTIRSLANLGNVAMELLETEYSTRLGRYQHLDSKKARSSVLRIRSVGLGLWGVGMLLIVIYGEVLVGEIFGASYGEYSGLLTLLWMSNAVVFLYRLNAVYLRTAGKSDVVMKGYLAGVVVMLFVGIPLVGSYGLLGGVILVILGAITILFGQYVFEKRIYAS